MASDSETPEVHFALVTTAAQVLICTICGPEGIYRGLGSPKFAFTGLFFFFF
jgi:hypothetical protein